MANIDPVASVNAAGAARSVMGETQVTIGREAARRLSEMAEAANVTRKEFVEKLIMEARGLKG